MLFVFLIFSLTIVTLLTTCLQFRKREDANENDKEVYVPVLRKDAKKTPKKAAQNPVKIEKPNTSTDKFIKAKIEPSETTFKSDVKTPSEKVMTSSTESSHEGPPSTTVTQKDPPKEDLGNIKLVPRKPKPAKSLYVSKELRTEKRVKDSILNNSESFASDVTLPYGDNDTTLRDVPSLLTDMGTVVQRRSDENVILASNDFGVLNDQTDADAVSEAVVSEPQDSLASITHGSYYVTQVPPKQNARSTYITREEFGKKKIIEKI